MNIMSADLRLKKELKDLECAKREIEDIFVKVVQNFKQISIATVQRKLRIGYAKASGFIEVLEAKNIVSKTSGMRNILNKELLIREAVEYFAPIIRDRNKLNEINKYDIFAYVLNDSFDAENVDYFWLNRLISEHFVNDKIFIETLDELFGTSLSKIKDLKRRTLSVLGERKIDLEILAVVTLQYFAEKLKQKTLENCNDINKDFKEKIKNLRFFNNANDFMKVDK